VGGAWPSQGPAEAAGKLRVPNPVQKEEQKRRSSFLDVPVHRGWTVVQAALWGKDEEPEEEEEEGAAESEGSSPDDLRF